MTSLKAALDWRIKLQAAQYSRVYDYDPRMIKLLAIDEAPATEAEAKAYLYAAGIFIRGKVDNIAVDRDENNSYHPTSPRYLFIELNKIYGGVGSSE